MNEMAGLGLFASIFGGVMVAAANWLFNRDKARSETARNLAAAKEANSQAELNNANAAKIRAETTPQMRKDWVSDTSAGQAPEVWGEPPTGWRAGELEGASTDYVVGVDTACFHSGHAAGYIRAVSADPAGFGVLSQRFQAQAFCGARIRLSGYIRVAGVTGWAGLWMRVDGKDGELQRFDNMEQRPVKGTSEWVRREVVLDVPRDAYAIAIGALLVGAGQVWLDDLRLETVGLDVPTTVQELTLLEAPVNLAFEL